MSASSTPARKPLLAMIAGSKTGSTTGKSIMESREIFIEVDIGLGDSEATAWGCDLTYDYVKINAMYTT